MSEFEDFVNDMKYLGRLDRGTFKTLLFPHALDDYLYDKWMLFQTSPIHFLWSCDLGRVAKIENYIEEQKWGRGQ